MKLNKLQFIVFSLFISLFSHSQQNELGLNAEFLNSLPEDVRIDLMNELEKEKPKEKIDYGIFSSSIDKNFAKDFIEQELLKTKTIKDPRSMTIDDLEPFGKSFFVKYPSSFMPVTEPALTSEYILNVGDAVSIEITGSLESESEVEISRQGTILIPKVGIISVIGLSISDATIAIKSAIKKMYIGADAYITVSAMADIQVLVTGFVEVPGIYTLGAGSSVLSALRTAGGISEQGSYRNIELKRSGSTLLNFDLYDLFIDGDLSSNEPLRAGDVIHVTPVQELVSVYGGIKRPAIYEVINETVLDVIRYAGGSFLNSEISNVSLGRLVNNKYLTRTINKDQFSIETFDANDRLFIPNINISNEGFFHLRGSFRQKGSFASNFDNKFIVSKDNLSHDAYPVALVFKDFNEDSKSYNYSLKTDLNSVIISANDEFIALSSNDINFLNSTALKDFFGNNHSAAKYSSCKLFDHLENLRPSSRFKSAKNILNPVTLSLSSQQEDLTALKDSLSVDADQSYPSGMFIKQDCKIAYNPIFDNDPDLLLFLTQNSVIIEGFSYKSGLYPVEAKTPLMKLINYSRTFTDPSSPQDFYISNSLETKQVSILDANNLFAQPGSSLTFPSSKFDETNTVNINGAVKNPGTYFLSPNTRLSQLIEMAGGYEKHAFFIGGTLTRESAKKVEYEYQNRLYDDLIQTISGEIAQGTAVSYDGLNLVLSEFKSIKPAGRVIAEFNPTILKRNPTADIILEENDSIYIPPRSNVVYVLGEVLSPGPQNYNPDFSHKDYVKRAGGFTKFVEKGSIIQVLPNGESEQISMSFFNLPFNENNILPGTVIYATRDISKLNNIKLASTLAPVISSIAISLASLNSINNN